MKLSDWIITIYTGRGFVRSNVDAKWFPACHKIEKRESKKNWRNGVRACQGLF